MRDDDTRRVNGYSLKLRRNLRHGKVTRTGSIDPLIVADDKQGFPLEIASTIRAALCKTKIEITEDLTFIEFLSRNKSYLI